MAGTPDLQLSLVIPVYNAASFIEQTVDKAVNYLNSTGLNYELIFVDDGSQDNSQAVLNNLKDRGPICVIRLEHNQGKFAAIAEGMQAARGKCCVFTDADLPYDLRALPYMTQLIGSNVIHLVVGDRRLPQSESVVKTTALRKLASFILATIIRLLMTGGLHDSQCGLKGFRNDVAKAIFPMLRFRRFAGDIEVLYIALKYNLTIKRIPVRLVNSAPSTVRLQLDFLGFLHCIFSMRLNWELGRYRSKELASQADRPYWSN